MVELRTAGRALEGTMNHGNVALILEDDPLVRRALVRGLSLLGFICESGASIAEASRMSGPWDVAIVDIDLPDGSGVSFVENLFALDSSTRAIFFSATEDPRVVTQASSLGHFISKSEGIGAVLGHLGQHRETSATRSRPAPPASGARSIGWTGQLDEPSPSSFRATK